MTIRTIYVYPEDLLRIRVIGHEDGERNKRGWHAESIRPQQYIVYAKDNGLYISDPGMSIFLEKGADYRQIF